MLETTKNEGINDEMVLQEWLHIMNSTFCIAISIILILNL